MSKYRLRWCAFPSRLRADDVMYDSGMDCRRRSPGSTGEWNSTVSSTPVCCSTNVERVDVRVDEVCRMVGNGLASGSSGLPMNT